MDGLNKPQREAVKYIDSPLLVLAGAGSGKTSVITRKVAYLIEHCGISARNIAAVTFTNKAAREMRERVAQLVPKKSSKGLRVSTFHTLGLDIIKSHLKEAGLKSGFSILDAEDSLRIIKELCVQSNDMALEQLELARNQISTFKNQLISPEQATALAETTGEARIARLYLHYRDALKAYNAVDFDDLILLPVQLFEDYNHILEYWRNRIHYLLVDEYQDTNDCQYELVKTLVKGRGKLTVVGDDDQSIYAWRGARPENLAQLQEDFPDLKVVKLEQNYRSSGRILASANAVIGNNPHVFEKSLWSDLGIGDQIRVCLLPDGDDELDWIVDDLQFQVASKRLKYRDIAILYRSNHQARVLEIKLQGAGIPYQISGGTSFYAKTEIKDIMAYLRLLINPDDDNAFLRIINTPRRQIGTQTLQQLVSYATERGCGLFQASQEIGLDQYITGPGRERLQRFHQWFSHIQQACYQADPIPLILEMIEDIDYFGWLVQNASSVKVAEGRMKNVNLLIDSIRKMLEDQEDDDALEAAIGKLVLRDMLDEQQEESANDRVQLMTLHAAKGLEFPFVYLMGAEEGMLPHKNSIDTDNIEEERRLFYVGVTRAKQHLCITLAANRKLYGESIRTTPSRFIEEIPAEHLTRQGFESQTPEEEKQKGNDARASLKAMFS
ncbi:MAG: UvrD-helicase domain-containing protein [Porticoccaceae bacterium]